MIEEEAFILQHSSFVIPSRGPLAKPVEKAHTKGLPSDCETITSQSLKPKYATIADWDAAYRKGTPPWDSSKPHAELLRVLDEYRLRPQTVLEIGCGTGADAILLAQRRYEVTAVDCSPIAIERARLRAEQHGALLRLVLDDVFDFAHSAGPSDFVYDAGLYHAVRQENLERYLDMLWRVTQPGSHYLCLAGRRPHRPNRPKKVRPRSPKTKSTTSSAGSSSSSTCGRRAWKVRIRNGPTRDGPASCGGRW